MGTDWILFIGMVAAIFPRKGFAIMCSKCDSSKYPLCQVQPPAPVTCVSSGSSIPQSCSVVWVYKKDTGALDQFVRSCSIYQHDECFDSQPGYETCAHVCNTDGCNSAPSVTTATGFLKFLTLFCPTLVSLLMLLLI